MWSEALDVFMRVLLRDDEAKPGEQQERPASVELITECVFFESARRDEGVLPQVSA
jgi:hypothetical protein